MSDFKLNSDGVFLVPEFSATGGVSYKRTNRNQEQTGNRLVEDYETRKEVDDVELVTLSKSIINRAYSILEKYTTQTPVGRFATPENELRVREELQELERAADEFNTASAVAGSEREVRIGVYAVALVLDDQRAAQRLRETILTRLTGLRDALARANREAFDRVWSSAWNLDTLACGIQADALRMAIDAAKTARRMIPELAKDGLTAHEIGERLELGAIDSAIALFSA